MATYKVRSDGTDHTVHIVDNPGGGATVTVDDEHEFQVEFTGGGADVPAAMATLPEVHAPHSPSAPSSGGAAAAGNAAPATVSGPGGVTAPIPGKIVSIDVAVGDRVEANALVMTLEAMKMENNIVSPISGSVSQIAVGEGSEVAAGELLMVIEP